MGSSDRKRQVTRGDVRLLLSAALFLGAVLVRTSGAVWADELRVQAASLLHDGMHAGEVLEAAGRTLEKGGLTAVFARTEQPQSAAKQPTAQLGEPAESGYGEDELSVRTESNFPKQADETVYVLGFETQTPVEGVRTSAFGLRIHPITGEESFHYGLDIAADEGTPVAAFADGTARAVGYSSYGNYVILDHADGFSTLYAHCSSIGVKEGEHVGAGEPIAAAGATGSATGSHLHLELWRNGKALDPAHYLTS